MIVVEFLIEEHASGACNKTGESFNLITIARLTSVLFMTNTFFLDNPALLSFLNTRG